MNKVLIISYYWPPAGGAGVQRVLKFVKYLPQFGWEPVVLTVENPNSPVDDTSLLSDIPERTKVYKTKSLEPFKLYKKFLGKEENDKIPGDVLLTEKDRSAKNKLAKWIRLNLFIPDAKIGWKNFAVKEGLEIIKKEKVDLIFTTSPPQTTSIIGRILAKKTGVKWIADFRDPWMEIVYYQNVKRSYFTKKIDSSFERKVLNSADALVTISNDMAELFRSKSQNQNIKVIPNGYDDSDFEEFEMQENDKFTISYTGSMSKDRVPYPLFKALKKLIYEDGINQIQLKFAGRFCEEFSDEVENKRLTEYFSISGFVPHKESTEILQSSDVLLLVVDNVPDNKGFLTGKIFEYMGCRKPIFAIGPINGDANDLIKHADCGTMVDYNDEDKAYEVLKKMYDDWKSNTVRYKYDVEKFNRKVLTQELASLFEEMSS